MKTVEYPMALTTFSMKEWEAVLSPVMMALLPKAGVCRSFPQAVVYAPLRFQGLGVPHPFATQMCKHLDMLLRHLANSTATGGFLSANIQAHQLETGTSFGIFQQEYCNTGILASDTWIKRVWSLLDQHRVHVEFDSPRLDLRRDGDSLLMDLFVDAEVDQDTLLWLNWCRMYLHVVTVSDIATADGQRISSSAWLGLPDTHQLDRYHWPRTCRPAAKWWKVWRHWLSVTLLGYSSSPRRLSSPLGSWFSDSFWRWQFSPSQNRLFHLEGGGWVEALPSTRSLSRNFLLPQQHRDHTSLFVSSLPSDCQLASVSRRGTTGHVTVLGSGRVERPPSLPGSSILDYWHLYRSQISGSYGWIPESISIHGSEDKLRQALLDGRLRISCDGSFKDGLGTAVAQLRTVEDADIIWIKCQTPGRRSDQSSTRSELIGILASLMVLEWLASTARLRKFGKRPSVEVGCDGLVALQKCFDPWPLQPSSKQFDMASSVRAILRVLPVQVKGRHVKGHADRHQSLSQLTWWELRNREVDLRAQDFRKSLESMGSPAPRNPRFFSEPCALFVQGEKLSRLSFPAIMDLLAEPGLHKYWARQTHPRITPIQFREIDWDVMDRAVKALPPYMQRWTTKHTVGMCGVGKFRRTWNFDLNASCPRCTECEEEDHLHVIRCRGTRAVTEWSLRFSSLISWMEGNHTAPEIIAVFSAFLSSIRDPATVLNLNDIQSSSPALFRDAVRSQSLIGAQGLIEGLLSIHWCTLQQNHFRNISSSRSVSLWASRLVQQLLLVGHHMWTNRNAQQHSEDNTRYLGRHQEVDRGIREQYSMGRHDAPAQVCSMLRDPIRAVLARSLEEREHWCSLASRERARH